MLTTLNIKIVGVENDSVLVKFSSQNSKKSIDEYDPVAFQPKAMGYNTLDEFIEGIKPSLLVMVSQRDKSENTQLDLNSWVDHSVTTESIIPNVNNYTQLEIQPPLTNQVINTSDEVIL